VMRALGPMMQAGIWRHGRRASQVVHLPPLFLAAAALLAKEEESNVWLAILAAVLSLAESSIAAGSGVVASSGVVVVTVSGAAKCLPVPTAGLPSMATGAPPTLLLPGETDGAGANRRRLLPWTGTAPKDTVTSVTSRTKTRRGAGLWALSARR
jgi:hypothetical protein